MQRLVDEMLEEQQAAARAALAGREVLYEHLRPMPSRTVACCATRFAHLKSLAKTGTPRSIWCLPVLNPLGNAGIAW